MKIFWEHKFFIVWYQGDLNSGFAKPSPAVWLDLVVLFSWVLL